MNTCIMHLAEECVFRQDKLKTVVDICFLLGSYIDRRKILDELAIACQDYRSLVKVIF